MDNATEQAILGESPLTQSEPVIGGDILMGNDSLFDDFTEDDLAIPEPIMFNVNEKVVATITDCRKNEKGLGVDLKVETGEHADKLIEYFVFDPKTSNFEVNKAKQVEWKMFILSIWSREEILGGKATEEIAIGRKIEFVAAKPFTKKSGEVKQDYRNMVTHNEEQTNNIGL